MQAALAQTNLNSSATLIVAIVVLVLALALMAFLFLRSNVRRREREERVRNRLLEMEREAQFASAADRVRHLRQPAGILTELAGLLREYIPIQVLAVYAGRAGGANLSDVTRETDPKESLPPRQIELPALIPAPLEQRARPAVTRLAAFVREASQSGGQEPGSATGQPMDERTSIAEPDQRLSDRIDEQPTNSIGEDALLLPWHGPFEWNGLIVAAIRPGFAVAVLEPYREAIARLTDRLAVALEFERCDSTVEASEERAARTTGFSRALISCLEDKSPLDAIVRQVTNLVGSDSAALWRIDESTSMIRMVAAHGLKSPEFLPLPLGQGLTGSAAQNGEALAIENAPLDPRCIFPREARESGVVSYLGAPLASNGETLGVIEAHCSSRRSWTEGDKRSLESAAAVIAELLKSTDSRGNRLRVESAYLGLSESLQRLRSTEEVKEAVVEVLGHALGASRVLVVEFTDEGGSEPVKHEYRQPYAKSAAGVVFDGLIAALGGPDATRTATIAESTGQSLMGPETAADLEVVSEMALPIRIDGKSRGIIYVHQCDRVRDWEAQEVEFAERVASQLSLSLSNLQLLERALRDAQDREQSGDASARIKELEHKLEGLERTLEQSRISEEQTKTSLGEATALEAHARGEVTDLRNHLEGVQQEHRQVQSSAQQLLEINKLKSEFIVSAGREIEASLQSVLGLSELLERGSYGNLTGEQLEAVRGIYGWARRIKSDVDSLIDYGSTRSRRLE
ncbi:MAG: GAF domain-containing protein [Blastocatellia bacterium]